MNDRPASPLISAEELGSLLTNPRLRLFDVRGRWGGSVENGSGEPVERLS